MQHWMTVEIARYVCAHEISNALWIKIMDSIARIRIPYIRLIDSGYLSMPWGLGDAPIHESRITGDENWYPFDEDGVFSPLLMSLYTVFVRDKNYIEVLSWSLQSEKGIP